jgi:hypothetical protein
MDDSQESTGRWVNRATIRNQLDHRSRFRLYGQVVTTVLDACRVLQLASM